MVLSLLPLPNTVQDLPMQGGNTQVYIHKINYLEKANYNLESVTI